MIRYLIDFALRNRILVLSLAVVLFIWGMISFHNLPIEAYPDVADTYTQVITQWSGHAAEEVEQQITVPLEVQLNGVAHMTHLRSTSLAGLSVITIIYDDDTTTLNARQEVIDRLQQVTLPSGVSPSLGPDYSPTGQIMFYTLQSTSPKYDVMELKTLNDWFVVNQLKSVPNIVSVNPFGGPTREYQVQIDPGKLVSYGLSLSQVEQALAANNTNAGGGFIERGQQALNVRAVGLMQTTEDIGATVVKMQNGAPIRVRDLAQVAQAPKVRLGELGKTIHREDGVVINDDDVVEGIVLLRKGAEADATLDALHEKIAKLNNGILPPGVKLVPHLDRSDLVHYTTHTVLRNLTDGVLLVTLILFLFLGNVRSALIVTLTIPFSLLFAAILLDLSHIPANLLSLGALDFGMVVDGSVVMVENILRHAETGGSKKPILEMIATAAHEVQRPVFFARIIIIVSYLPIFTLQRVEGRLFRPMAWTVAFALLGALLFALLIAPVLCSMLFKHGIKEWQNPALRWLQEGYGRTLDWCFEHLKLPLAAGVAALALMLFLGFSGIIGSEFLPHLDEGAVWVRGTLAPSAGPATGIAVSNTTRLVLARFPEVKQVISQVGRPDDGSDASGFYNTEFFVDLLPRAKWRSEFKTKDDLIAAMDKDLSKFPGVDWNFSQPISDNVEEAVSNNVFGLLTLLNVAQSSNCATFVMISSDKAVNPTNVMGCTKRVGELILAAWPGERLRCVSVRFGNVLGSNGSVIPLFQEQIRQNLPITITHPEITRFFMTISEAVSLVLQAFAIGRNGDILVLDMGEPVRVADLAKTLVRLSGKSRPEFKFIGLRPGEKLFEELFYPDERVLPSACEKIACTESVKLAWPALKRGLDELYVAVSLGKRASILAHLKQIVPQFTHSGCDQPGSAVGVVHEVHEVPPLANSSELPYLTSQVNRSLGRGPEGGSPGD